jgi:poly(A) polymerase
MIIQGTQVPPNEPLAFSPILSRISPVIPADLPIYIVGGAIRDALLQRPIHDLDFILPADALRIARSVANSLDAAYYPLDEERQIGRVIVNQTEGGRLVLDFALYQGIDLTSDLQARDFTVNAMAVEVRQPQALIDPTGGLKDLRAKYLRACSPEAFRTDPVRILRGVRLGVTYNFRILPDSQERMRDAVPLLPSVSAERLRDELFRILESPRPASSVRALDRLGVIGQVLPEMIPMKGTAQSPPHVGDVWEHTLDVVQKMEVLLEVLAVHPNPDISANLTMGLVSVQLGRYRNQIAAHLHASLNPNRSLRSLLFLAGLYHDAGKPQTAQTGKDGRLHFYEHEKVGEQQFAQRAQALHLSNAETNRAKTVIRHHLRPILLAQNDQVPSRRAIYRFFRETGLAGVDICLLSLADVLGTYGPVLPGRAWVHQVEVVRMLLEAWWEQSGQRVSPPPLVTGDDLQVELGLSPGPLIGQILEAIREAQVMDQVKTRAEALLYAREVLSRKSAGGTSE